MSSSEHYSGNEFQNRAARDKEFSASKNAECERHALALTALFDGEMEGAHGTNGETKGSLALSAEAIAAREHLSRCLRCAEMWRFWSQSRCIWRATPSVSTPPGLLLRILMACRLTALRHTQMRPTQARHSQSSASTRSAQEMHAPLASAIDVPPVPAHLRDAILQRTVGLARDKEILTSSLSAPPMARREVSTKETRKTRYGPLWSSNTVRWAGAVAVPAALMLMATLVDQTPQIEDAPQPIVAQSQNSSRSAPRSAVKKLKSNATRRVFKAISSVQKTTSNIASGAAAKVLKSEPEDDASRVVAARIAAVDETPPRRSNRVASLSRDENNRVVWRSDVENEVAEKIVTRPRFAFKRAPKETESQLIRTQKPRIRPQFALASQIAAPRILQPARGIAARVTLSSVARRDGLLKTANRATQVRARNSQTLAHFPARGANTSSDSAWANADADYDEVDDVQRVAGAEADQIRSIVNQYRAALLDDEESANLSTISETL